MRQELLILSVLARDTLSEIKFWRIFCYSVNRKLLNTSINTRIGHEADLFCGEILLIIVLGVLG